MSRISRLARAIGAVAKDDAAWFRANAGQRLRLRPIQPVELATMGAPEATHVVVKQLWPGARMRRPATCRGEWLLDDDAVLERLFLGGTVVVHPEGRA